MSSPSTESRIAMAQTLISTIGSVAAAAMVVRSVSRDYLPPEFQDYLYLNFRKFLNKFSNQLTMVFYEFEGFNDNEVYTATQLYLSSRISSDIHRLKVAKTPNEQHFNLSMEINEEYTDVYKGVNFTWSLVSKKKPTREYYTHDENGRSSKSDLRSLELTFHRKHKDLALNSYLPFIITSSKTIIQNEKTVKLFTVERKTSYTRYPTTWTPVNLDHPATFETVAMDTGVKEMVVKDLDRFLERREYYRKVGKAWKRGYLLYGPPGTGKSSLIAAMANYLKFDIYDLELTNIHSNSELRRLLVATANRSILVVEDIDCSVELHDRVQLEREKAIRRDYRRGYEEEPKVTLSGFLNFIDGLWSSCGDERIIIFTTNRKEKLDPALIRPGRMDVHIHMSYCTPSAFRLLVSNYLGITEHNLFEDIDELISHMDVTPAEVAEQLLKDNDPDIALGGLIEFFDVKRKENEEAKARLKEAEELAAKESEKKQEEDAPDA
ncbi:putative AAA+ ATPase domain, ATPase, AAA-type, core, AAA-type ATPase domain-containing protein [Helianthus annuus]|nr:putative AAA+ ATPase domain, ATPase, AAA-type, core, AAA-type ATPase domain-containing protein [Helianthus annuus]